MSGLNQQIEAVVMTQLVAPYRRKDAKLQSTGELPGNWFGLEEIGFQIVANDLLVHRFTCRTDDDLCTILQVPLGSTYELTENDGKTTTLDISGFNHSPDKLETIKQELAHAILSFILRA